MSKKSIRLTVASKLYAVFTLVAIATMTLAATAVYKSMHHAALFADFETAFVGSQNVEHINSLVYAVVMESRGVYMSTDKPTAKKYGDGLLKFNNQITKLVEEWKKSVRADDAAAFAAFEQRVKKFVEFRNELVRLGNEVGPPAAREWGDNDANRSVRTALNRDLDALAQLYTTRSRNIYHDLDASTRQTTWMLGALAAVALLLIALGVFIIGSSVTRPLSAISAVTHAVADGDTAVAVPYSARQDEIGDLARSIGVFQRALERNAEMQATILQESNAKAQRDLDLANAAASRDRDEVEARNRRQQALAAEIDRFGGVLEATLAELAHISRQALSTSKHLSDTAAAATECTDEVSTASQDASSKVRDVAAAAEQLAAAVNEIDRQVNQSQTIAEQAINEAERTNVSVQELDAAAKRIGDVIGLITDIAAQTNLLALNATIEAARAGEAGKGFAVVASEVKALAGQTAKATEEISTQIAGMQQATGSSIAAIKTIQATIRNIGDITAAIAASVTEQGTVTREIAAQVENASSRTGHIADGISKVGAATSATSADAGAMKTIADELGQAASRIRQEVDGFFERLKAA
jgi:methyl-accepting chemotaxis protein